VGVVSFRRLQRTRFEYNLKGKITKSTDPLGRETDYFYGTNNVVDPDPTTEPELIYAGEAEEPPLRCIAVKPRPSASWAELASRGTTTRDAVASARAKDGHMGRPSGRFVTPRSRPPVSETSGPTISRGDPNW
jgi:hypothetical protein